MYYQNNAQIYSLIAYQGLYTQAEVDAYDPYIRLGSRRQYMRPAATRYGRIMSAPPYGYSDSSRYDDDSSSTKGSETARYR